MEELLRIVSVAAKNQNQALEVCIMINIICDILFVCQLSFTCLP